VDETVILARLLGEPARRDAGIAFANEQAFRCIQERLLGFLSRR